VLFAGSGIDSYYASSTLNPRRLLNQLKTTPAVCYPPRVQVTSSPRIQASQRHTALVRITHWITVISFITLLVTGCEIVISHPRFYWGETGNSGTTPLFQIPVPASRVTVPTGYNYMWPDQNGWSRYLHFEAAWVLVITGLIYVAVGLLPRHFSRNMIPALADRKWKAFREVFAKYLRRAPPDPADSHAYNVVQRTAYLSVIFILFPFVIWTGLALSPAFDSALPAAVNLLGGRRSARTLHFFISGFLLLFLIVHVAMISLGGFWRHMRAMITGRLVVPSERRP
jgi:thiosulfate reductase cytochrome b subunit